jgi:hypothetical protein
MDEMTFGHLSQAREPSTSPFLLRICDSVTLRDERSPHSDLGHPVWIAVQVTATRQQGLRLGSRLSRAIQPNAAHRGDR